MSGAMVNLSGGYNGYFSYHFSNRNMRETSFADIAGNKENTDEAVKSQRGTVMADYYRSNPLYKAVQESRVREGYRILTSEGLSADELERMSLDDFKDTISKTIGSIPLHPTRLYDEETVIISDEGWDNMKADTDYTAWMLGYLKEDRSVSNPFSGTGDKGSFCVQNFGASPEEYHGHSYSKIFGGTAAGARTMYRAESADGGIETRAIKADMQPPKDYNLWEVSRRARRKDQQEILEAQLQAKTQQKKQISDMHSQIEYENKEIQRILDSRIKFEARNTSIHRTKSPAAVAASYEAMSRAANAGTFL